MEGELDMITMGKLLPSLPLGRWTAPTHRHWRCYLNKATDQLEVRSGDKVELYTYPRQGTSKHVYTGMINRVPQGSLATVVEGLAPRSLRLKNTGHNMFYEDLLPITTFKDHLRSFGGTWMWNDLYVPDDIN